MENLWFNCLIFQWFLINILVVTYYFNLLQFQQRSCWRYCSAHTEFYLKNHSSVHMGFLWRALVICAELAPYLGNSTDTFLHYTTKVTKSNNSFVWRGLLRTEMKKTCRTAALLVVQLLPWAILPCCWGWSWWECWNEPVPSVRTGAAQLLERCRLVCTTSLADGWSQAVCQHTSFGEGLVVCPYYKVISVDMEQLFLYCHSWYLYIALWVSVYLRNIFLQLWTLCCLAYSMYILKYKLIKNVY